MSHVMSRLSRGGHSPPIRNPQSAIRNLLPLLLLTFLAAALRFIHPDRPCLWGDEAWVYSRACGTYQQMLAILRHDGFGPLHYEFYWVLCRFLPPGPSAMRFLPALAGTLMVPAIHFLARQVVARHAALLAAAFACCSAYLLHYSRDCKMYCHFWLCCTLFMGCLLWWLRTGRAVPWLAWVAAGLAMLGIDFLGGMLLPIALVIVVSHRRAGVLSWLKYSGGFVLGLLVLGAGVLPLFKDIHVGDRYVTHKFYQWTDRSQDQVLGWAKWYNAGRDGLDDALYATTAYLFCWEWHQDVTLARPPFPGTTEDNIPPRMLAFARCSTVALIGLPLLGALPWRAGWRRWKGRGAGAGPPAAGGPEASAEPASPGWGRSILWLGTWVAVPAYFIYCSSAFAPVGPRDWLEFARDLLSQPLIVAVLAAAAVFAFAAAGTTMRDRFRRTGVLLVAAGVPLAICFLLTAVARVPTRGSVWQPRYVGVVFPAFIVAVSALLVRLPTRPVRWLAVGLLLAINLTVAAAPVVGKPGWVEPPIDALCADVVRSQGPTSPTRTYFNFVNGSPAWGQGGFSGMPARYYLMVHSGKRVTPEEFRQWLPMQSRAYDLFELYAAGTDEGDTLTRWPGPVNDGRAGDGGGDKPDPLLYRLDRKTLRRDSAASPGASDLPAAAPAEVGAQKWLRAGGSPGPGVREVVVWERFDGPLAYGDLPFFAAWKPEPTSPVPPAAADDPVLQQLTAQLGPGWRRAGVQDFPVYAVWTWQYYYTVQQRRYVRDATPAEPAAVPPTTVPANPTPVPHPGPRPPATRPAEPDSPSKLFPEL